MRVIKFRRRLEGKTDYNSRIALLQGKLPRIVIRKTNKYIIAQVVKSKEAQDFVVCAANSKELKGYGYNFNLKNIPAAYLTGFLIGLKAQKAKERIKKAILDIGLQRSTKGSKIYAALKGFADAGIEVNYSKDICPSEERIMGKHIKEDISSEVAKVKEKIKEKFK